MSGYIVQGIWRSAQVPTKYGESEGFKSRAMTLTKSLMSTFKADRNAANNIDADANTDTNAAMSSIPFLTKQRKKLLL